MSVGNILSLTGKKMGLSPSNTNQREVLLRYLNEACYEIWNQADVIGSLMEVVLKVNGNQTIALPHYVGELRAVREFWSMIPWSINQMRPRYNQQNWPDYWRNWRIKNRSPLMASITNESVVVVVVPTFDALAPITVTITGSTATAALVSETLTINALSVQSVNQYIEIASLTKSQVTNYDLQLQDIDGKLLTVIPNNELQAWYQIVDISDMPWLTQNQSSLDHCVEVLFKKTLPLLSQDSDEFPAQGYDFIVSNKMMQIWAQEQGKAEMAASYDRLTTRSLARRQEEANRATQDKIPFVVNGHDTLLPRIRSRRPGRYGGYGSLGMYGRC